MDNNKEPIGVCILVLNKTSILLGKRKGGYRPGTYGLPGGRIESNESLLEAAKRELYEETGLTSDSLSYCGVVRDWQDDHNFIHFIFVANQYIGNPENKEPDKCESWEWFDTNTLPETTLKGHKLAIELINNQLALKENL